MIIKNTFSNNKSAILVADLHLHHKPDWRFIWNNEFIDELINNNIQNTDLILLGDVFETKNNVDSRVLNQFLSLVLSWLNTDTRNKVFWITGQHDSYLPGKATLEKLDYVERITIISEKEYKLSDTLYAVPYARDVDYYRQMLNNVPDNVTVLTHMPIKEALGAGGKEFIGMELKEFKRFKKVISGDIHNYLDLQNFSYVGATSQLNWKDEGVEGQIGELSVNNELTRIPLEHPIHVKVSTLIQAQRIIHSPNKLIVKITSDKMDLKKLSELKKLNNVLDCLWEPPVTEILKTTLIDEQTGNNIGDPEQVINAHLEGQKLPEKLSLKEIQQCGMDLYNNIYIIK